ncbi:hypothetical protein B0I37DRAFT_440396 [Chaetomium sp. MPI-CAGE-AT-0009]|nr:hypothetical protein B0I37DRAFT_440396 [Chaetomium sp. MPI-CAGE-AT-0009]
MPVAALGHVFALLIFGSAFAGSIADFCRNNPGPGCVNRRDLLQKIARADAQVDRGVKVWTSIPSAGVAQFDNIPPACMNLAVALSGSCTGEGPRPVPCGSACMQYRGISDDQIREISSYLRS